MSTLLAQREMRRFLSTSNPEVLSISGRWGVGKTHGWRAALREMRASGVLPMDRYAYVSAFGVKSLDDLKTAIFQATVKLGAPSIEPTLRSFQDNLSSVGGFKHLAERTGRKGVKLAGNLVSALPYGEKAADLILPGAALLIRNQIVCIDDIERTGEGLEVSDILGFVSMLREEKGCKIVLLLNEEGLGKDEAIFRTYLEKVVDQAIHYTPTPKESAAAALKPDEAIEAALSTKVEQLGITNIRVIQRINRFVHNLVPELAELHPDVTEQAISTVALLGWCVFEPRLAPGLEHVKAIGSYPARFAKSEPSEEEARWNALLSSYGYTSTDEFDRTILAGLQAGGFDMEAVMRAAAKLSDRYARTDVQMALREPQRILESSLDFNEDEMKNALVTAVEKFAGHMSARDLDEMLQMLLELGEEEKARELLPVYMAAQKDKPRDFFNIIWNLSEAFGPEIIAHFAARAEDIPLTHDPLKILLKIDRDSAWSTQDVAVLSSMSEDEYVQILHAARERDLQSVIRAGLLFGQFKDAQADYVAISQKMRAALQRIGDESPLNAMRVRPYIGRPEKEGPAPQPVPEVPQ